jgi:predicted transposase/invertase (TIGR01784 family)
MRFLNIKTDYAFKKVFGSENSKNILKSFLNSTLDLASPIESLTIVDPYNVPKLQGMKETAVDVKATLEDKTKVIIEMQILNHDGFESRILYNTAKNYANQLDKGAKYHLLNPVIALTIVNFTMFEFDKYKSIFKLLEKKHFTEYKDDIQLQFIELPKFDKSLDECTTIEDKWIYFIKNARDMEVAPAFKDPNLIQAVQIANTASMSKEELEIRDTRQKRRVYIYAEE